jgi:hypothetical protein
MNRKTTTLSLAAALLLMSPAFADDGQGRQQQQQQAPQGGLVGGLAPLNDAPIRRAAQAPVTQAPSSQAQATAPVTAPVNQAPAAQALPGLDQPMPDLDAATPIATPQGLPQSLGDQADLSPQLPALGDQTIAPTPINVIAPTPIQGMPGAQDQADAQSQPKKPGFFKRMWTKVKTFFTNVKEKLVHTTAAAAEVAPTPIQQGPEVAPTPIQQVPSLDVGPSQELAPIAPSAAG